MQCKLEILVGRPHEIYMPSSILLAKIFIWVASILNKGILVLDIFTDRYVLKFGLFWFLP